MIIDPSDELVDKEKPSEQQGQSLALGSLINDSERGLNEQIELTAR